MILINKIKQWFCDWWYGHAKYKWRQEILPNGDVVNYWDCPRCGYTHKIIYKLGNKVYDNQK
jgi:hypothetical protein